MSRTSAPPRRRAARLWMAAGLGLALLSACAAEGDGQPGPAMTEIVDAAQVTVVDNAFEPAVVEVAPGETVTWTWQAGARHNVVGDGFESPLQDQGTFSHTFDEPGEYHYTCQPHAGMDGKIVVVEP